MGCYPTGSTVAFHRYGQLHLARWRSTRVALALATFAVLGASSKLAHAVVTGHINVTNTDTDPDDYNPAAVTPGQPAVPDWTFGDPGWDNVTTSGSNFVYIGDNWILTARHISAAAATFNTGIFPHISSQNFIVSNPPSHLVNGVSLTTQTDLRLFRISGNVGLPALEIASQSPPLIGTGGNSQVMFIGRGRIRASTETHWAMNISRPPPDWSDAEVHSGGNVHGYKTCTSNCIFAKRWGTNRLQNPSSLAFGSNEFDESLSSTTAVLPLSTSDQQTRDVISMVTSFEPQSDPSALPFESQAVSSDSGGAVFYNRGTEELPDWELAGIVNATIIHENQPRTYAVYGNSTTFADLSYYNQPYRFSICDIMKTCGSYSIMGDVNLDGEVIGDGTGIASIDDVTAFVAGWGNNNQFGDGDYDTWTKGDLNLDGATNVVDFLLLRGALNGPINSSVMSSLFGGVPEPNSSLLALIAGAFFAVMVRTRPTLHWNKTPLAESIA
jgi:hypothetical protein